MRRLRQRTGCGKRIAAKGVHRDPVRSQRPRPAGDANSEDQTAPRDLLGEPSKKSE